MGGGIIEKRAPFRAVVPEPVILMAFLTKHNMSVSDFAGHCDVSPKTVYNWLHGVYRMKRWVGVVMAWLDYVITNYPEEAP